MSALATRLLGRGGGTALPGLVAQNGLSGCAARYYAAAARWLAYGQRHQRQDHHHAHDRLDTGGGRAARLAQPLGLEPGARLDLGAGRGGIAATGSLRGKYRVGLFEVDEAAVPAVLGAVKPRVLLLNNLFRDQLDRYGELEAIYSKWRAALPRMARGRGWR